MSLQIGVGQLQVFLPWDQGTSGYICYIWELFHSVGRKCTIPEKYNPANKQVTGETGSFLTFALLGP